MKPITGILRCGVPYEWSHECPKEYQDFKDQVTEAPILKHFEPMCQIMVETKVTNFAIRAVLSQPIEEQLHRIALNLGKMDQSEINYNIHETELFRIVAALKQWRRYLNRAHHQIPIYTEYKNLEYPTTTKILNKWQPWWAQEQAGYDIKIFYHPGHVNGKPDALSRHLEYCLKKGGGSVEENEN